MTVFTTIKEFIKGLSFRTGVIILIACLVFYALSFAQMLLPISPVVKGVLWTVFFGCAKAAQYSAILILGKAGVKKITDTLRCEGILSRKGSTKAGE